MSTYLCDYVTDDGIWCSVAFEADSAEEAEMVAVRNGWEFVGEYVDEIPAGYETSDLCDIIEMLVGRTIN